MLSLSLVAPRSGQMHQIMAHELAKQGQMEAAIGNFREGLRVDPKLPGVHFELAEALNANTRLLCLRIRWMKNQSADWGPSLVKQVICRVPCPTTLVPPNCNPMIRKRSSGSQKI